MEISVKEQTDFWKMQGPLFSEVAVFRLCFGVEFLIVFCPTINEFD